MQASRSKLLKKDVFGRIERVESVAEDVVRGDVSAARFPLAWMARRLLAREKRLPDNASRLSRLWMSTGKPVYVFITCRLMVWQDREGAGDRV